LLFGEFVNFVEVLIGCSAPAFSCKERVKITVQLAGGERQRSSLNLDPGYSAKAHCKGNQTYLEPNSDSLHKPIGGLSVLAAFAVKSMLKKAEGAYQAEVQSLYKWGIVFPSR
jgi:hypothetical protein